MRDAMAQPNHNRPRRFSEVDVIADQVSQLTQQVSKLTDQVSQLTTALGVDRANASNLTKRMDSLEWKMDSQHETKDARQFTFNMSTMGWVIAAAFLVLQAFMSGSIHLGK